MKKVYKMELHAKRKYVNNELKMTENILNSLIIGAMILFIVVATFTLITLLSIVGLW